jgi:hypothetical protein
LDRDKSYFVCKVLDDAGVNVLNGEAIEIAGVGFAGIAGFGGSFGRRMLNAWGEPLIKEFVQESITHAVRLEQALAKLQTERRIVVLHYSPIRATLEGEDPEIFALSRFQPIGRANQSIPGSALSFAVMPTTAFSMGKLRRAFPFITSLRRLFARPANPTALSSCKAVSVRR